MWSNVSSLAVVESVDIIKLDGVSGVQSFPTGGPARWSGSGGGDVIPQVSNIIKLSTGFRGRNKRGRIYLPFASEAVVSSGGFDPGTCALVSAAWQDFQADLIALGGAPFQVVAAYDRRHNGAGAQANEVITYLCEQESGTQRRRQQRNR
jgi:hypothetical protein